MINQFEIWSLFYGLMVENLMASQSVVCVQMHWFYHFCRYYHIENLKILLISVSKNACFWQIFLNESVKWKHLWFQLNSNLKKIPIGISHMFCLTIARVVRFIIKSSLILYISFLSLFSANFHRIFSHRRSSQREEKEGEENQKRANRWFGRDSSKRHRTSGSIWKIGKVGYITMAIIDEKYRQNECPNESLYTIAIRFITIVS